MMKTFLSIIGVMIFMTSCNAINQAQSNKGEAVASTPSDIFIRQSSERSFTDVETSLRAAIETHQLTLFTVVDHGQGAESVGSDIGQSKLFIFGNPKAGTPLMVANRDMGFALPMKVLIYTQKNGRVALRYTNIKAVARTYNLTGQGKRLEKIQSTLNEIIKEAQ